MVYWAHKGVHILMFRICEFTTLHDTKKSASVTKIRLFFKGDYPTLSGLDQCDYKGPDERERGVTKGQGNCQRNLEMLRCWHEDGERTHEL